MKRFTVFLGLALACLTLGAQAQKPSDKMGKMGQVKQVSGSASIVEGTVSGAPNGKMFTITTAKGSVTVDAGKGRFRNKKGRFVKSEMLTAGSTVKIKGMMVGSTLSAKDVEITSLDATPVVGKKPGRKPAAGKMDKMTPVAPAVNDGKMAPAPGTVKVRKPRKSNKMDKMAPAQAALVALDPRTGEIKAVVGGRNYASSQLNHLLSKRQPGSIFKPLVYAAALSQRVKNRPEPISPASMLLDEPKVFRFNKKDYEPGNYKDHYMGEVSLRQALAMSLNVATVSLAEEISFTASEEFPTVASPTA